MTVIIRKSVYPHDCPDTCIILASVEDGGVRARQGDPAHPFSQGGLCHNDAGATAAPGA
jgi:anaerobic selenocysteine-containing dehydrogenase